MRTASEIELFPMAQDLISIVNLSKIFSAKNDMTPAEACDLVTTAIVNSGEVVEIYRTCEPGVPICVGEVNAKFKQSDVLDALWMPFKSKWWESSAILGVIQASWGGTPETVAIKRTDAGRILGSIFDDEQTKLLLENTQQKDTQNQTKKNKEILGTNERNQLLKMVLGMALDSYGYDPVAKKNKATNDIAVDLSKFGINIDDDTVRKYLKEAANSVSYKMPSKT